MQHRLARCPFIRSTALALNSNGVEVGAILNSAKLHCRCINKEKSNTSDLIAFSLDGQLLLCDFYSFRELSAPGTLRVYLHRRPDNDKVLLDRMILYTDLPDKFISYEGVPFESETVALEGSITTSQYSNRPMSFFQVIRIFNCSSPFLTGKLPSERFQVAGTNGRVLESGYFQFTLKP